MYEVVDLVGVGGMGEVYRARDSRLDRAVAIKTLPEEFAKDSERLARFEREAKVLAQLNHPHIASIYGLETGASPALVMEMVEGDTLADRLQLGPLPLDEAIAIAHQAADALEHAHAQGIIHRDLKPANIKIGARDSAPKVKVLDFGLAKAMMADPNASSISAVSSPTITSPMNLTRAGLIMGTAAYMSPEQARGRHVDQRADIWAFGCVLYEMLTGERPFEGEEIADVLARVIQSEPDWTRLPATTPRSVRTLLERCLRKDPVKRLHSIADARLDLNDAGNANEVSSMAAPARSRMPPALGGFTIGAILAGLAAFVALSPAKTPASAANAIRFSIVTPEGWTIAAVPSNGRQAAAVSPDGQQVAVVLLGKPGRRIFLHRFDEVGFRELPGTEDARTLFWSPDSQHIGFGTATGIKRIDLTGAGKQQITEEVPSQVALGWNPANQIIYSAGGGRPLRVVPATGGAARDLVPLRDGVTNMTGPSWLPDGTGVMAVESRGDGKYRLVVHRDGTGIVELSAFEAAGNGSITALIRSGYLLLDRMETVGRTILTAQPLDLASMKLNGDPTVLVNDLNPQMSVSENGVLVYGTGSRTNDQQLQLFDVKGAGNRLPFPSRAIVNFDWSPDGRYVVFQDVGAGLSLFDVTRGVTTPLNPAGTDPQWSQDGKQVFFSIAGEKRDLYSMSAFGGAPELRYQATAPVYIEDVSADGKWLAAGEAGARNGWLIPLTSGRTPISFENAPPGTTVDEIQFSPDGKWVAYGLLGQIPEVFLAPVPPTGERRQVSVAGGAQPRWRGDGKALYYLGLDGSVMMVDVTFQAGAPEISPPRKLFAVGLEVAPGLDQLAVSPDGTRFLIRLPEQVDDESNRTLQVIMNWPSLLTKRP